MIDGIEEALDFIIQKYKNNVESLDDVRLAYCDEIKWNCSDCPFRHGETCENAIAEKLIERLIKVEEHQETNLEHYVAYYNNYDQCIYMDAVKLTNEAHRRLNNFEEAIEWLLEPYKPPKPKYKLTQFEFDLLNVQATHWYSLNSLSFLERLIAKGYFKGIPPDISIRDILDNCEVINE